MKFPLFYCTIFILLLTTVTTLAQDYRDYPLKDFYTPDIKRRSLEFDLIGQLEAEKEDKHLLKINQYSNFLSHINTRKTVSNLYITGSFFEKNAKQMDDYTDYQNFSGYITVGYEEKKYIKPKFFLQYGLNGSTTINSTKERRSEFDEEAGYGYIDVNHKANQYVLGGNVHAGIGTGRIENVTDARQALYILEALSKNGRLRKHLSNDEVFQFAQLISSVKNKRFLDARLHQIEEITKVDSFLVSGDYLTTPDATYFTTLYDLWLYGDLFERQSGKEFVINSHYINYYSRNVITRNEIKLNPYETTSPSYSLSASFLYERPFHLSWQHSVETSLSYRYRNEMKGDFKIKSIYLPFTYSLGYYPNTRTHLKLSIKEQLNRDLINRNTLIGDTRYKTKEEYCYFLSTLSLNAFYYVSPHLLLSAEAAANIIFSKYKIKEKQPDDPRSDDYLAPNSHSSWDTSIEFKATYKLF